MDVVFHQLSEDVMAYIIAQGRSKITIRCYQRCFASLGTYLDEKELPVRSKLRSSKESR